MKTEVRTEWARLAASDDRRARAIRFVAALATIAVVLALGAGKADAHDWNDAAIRWQPYDQGLGLAKTEKKPICLVVYTEWCGHCANFSKVFHDPAVVAESKRFVMILLDNDKAKEIGARYAPDGSYIPRTLFLSSDGRLEPEIHAAQDKFKYFYDEKNPAPLVAAMKAAAQKLE